MTAFARLIDAAGSEQSQLAFAGRAQPFAALTARARRYAAALVRRGVRPGDRVAVLGDPCPALVVANLGHYVSGAIHVPINTRYRGREIEHILEDSGARLVVVDREHRHLVDGDIERIDLDALPEDDAALPPPPGDRDPAMLIYTSGTTGASKGVALSYAAVVANMSALTGAWGWSERDTLSLMLPLFHVHGLCIGVHGALLRGTSILLHARFDPAALVDDVRARGATIFMGVPTMYRRLLEHLERHPGDAAVLAGARLFTSGSAPLPAADFARFRELTGHAILERYGMSETLITLSNPLVGERRPGSVGMPVPGCEIDIAADGELRVRGDSMMNGYWNQPEATAREHDNGWFKTGDVVTRDDDGYVRIVGRKSVDIIKSGGFKISAREIEDVLDGDPAVREVAVFGVDDPTWGQAIAVAVVPSAGFDGDADALLDRLAQQVGSELADYKKPRRILVCDELPRNALGKLQKHRLATLLESRSRT